MPTESAIGKNINAIGVALVIVYMLWVASTLTNTVKENAVMRAEISELKLKANEVVPRSENERRFSNSERSSEQNADRISKLEQYLMNRK